MNLCMNLCMQRFLFYSKLFLIIVLYNEFRKEVYMKKIMLYTIAVIVVLYFTEQVLELPYLLKTLIKLPLFTIIPLVSLKGTPLKMDKQHTKLMLYISLFVFLIIVIAYIVLSSFIDVSIIQEDISSRMQVTNVMLIYTGLYTIFINSFIEELFFRGFIFAKLLGKHKILAYVFSSLAFSIYHITIFKTWFTLPMFMLMMLGLFVGGLIFSYFTEKNNSFLASWFIHMSADLAIILIGWKLLFFVA